MSPTRTTNLLPCARAASRDSATRPAAVAAPGLLGIDRQRPKQQRPCLAADRDRRHAQRRHQPIADERDAAERRQLRPTLAHPVGGPREAAGTERARLQRSHRGEVVGHGWPASPRPAQDWSSVGPRGRGRQIEGEFRASAGTDGARQSPSRCGASASIDDPSATLDGGQSDLFIGAVGGSGAQSPQQVSLPGARFFCYAAPRRGCEDLRHVYSCSKCPGFCCSYPVIAINKRDVERLARFHEVTSTSRASASPRARTVTNTCCAARRTRISARSAASSIPRNAAARSTKADPRHAAAIPAPAAAATMIS